MGEPAKTHTIVVTRLLDAPVERVWKAWTVAEELMRWWGPTGFTSPSAVMDFREGGTSLVCMRAPAELGGQDMYNTWTYQRIVPMERIAFVVGFADKDGKRIPPTAIGLPPEMPGEVRHVVTLRAVSDRQTELTVSEYGYPSAELAGYSQMGLEQCLDKMAASLAG